MENFEKETKNEEHKEMMRHPETGHEISRAEHEDKAELLEEMHEHAKAFGPEHHEDILAGLRAEHEEYEPTEEDSEESDDEDEIRSERGDANKKKDEGDKREEEDEEEHYDEEEDEGSEDKKSSEDDLDKINKYITSKKRK